MQILKPLWQRTMLRKIKMIKFYKDWRNRRDLEIAQQALRDYVFYGKETPAFTALGSPLIEAGRIWRDGYLNESRQEIEKENIQFCAIQECPKCRLIDIPYFRLRADGNLNGRECRDCGFQWHTVG